MFVKFIFLTFILLNFIPSLISQCTTCQVGGTWSEWSVANCNDTCGLCGVMTQTRTCTSEAFGCPCTGPTSQIGARCEDSICPFPRPSCCSTYSKRAMSGGILKCIPLTNSTAPTTTVATPATTATYTICPETTTSTLATTTTTACISPPAGINPEVFILNGVSLVDGAYGMATPLEDCEKTSTGTKAYYSGDTTPDVPAEGSSAGQWDRSSCADPCVCDSAGECYQIVVGSSDTDPSIDLYPHCTSTTDCFIALVMSSDGSLQSTTTSSSYNSDNQINPDDFNTLPVSDPSYLKITSIGCNGCPVNMGS